MTSLTTSLTHSLPAAIETISLIHDETCGRIRSTSEAVESELSQHLDRGERLELAAAVRDVIDEVSNLYDAKLAAGFFVGFGDPTERCRERVAHLKSDYRRLLNDLRQTEHEITSGKSRKARRQMSHWLTRFADVIDHETALLNELWNSDASVE
jgi:hypothetical protein